MSFRLVTVLLLLCSAWPAGIFADESPPLPWKVGLARAEITPAEPMQMSGYAARKEPFEDVALDLHVKALALEDARGHRGLLITADLIGFHRALSDEICRRIEEHTGLERRQVLLNASHTHAGPVVTVGRAVDEENREKIERYLELLRERTVAAAVEALEDLQPARLAWGKGVADFVMNRREFTANGVRLGVQPSGLADRTVPVLRIQDDQGKLRAAVFGAACHNTTLTGGNLTLCGDYAGFAQQFVEEKHPRLRSMFVSGCGGDANPYPRGTMELAKRHGEALGSEVCRVLETDLASVNGPLRTTLRDVDLPLEPPSRARAEELAGSRASYLRYVGDKMLAKLDRGEPLPESYRAPFAVWQLGDDLTLVALSGETVVDYVKRTEEALGPLNLWVAGYSNDVFGYLPSARVLAEGGYETRGLIRGGAGLFAPQVEDTVVDAIIELAREAGRPLAGEGSGPELPAH